MKAIKTVSFECFRFWQYADSSCQALGANVATTIRNESKSDFVKKAGAELIVNTSNHDFIEKVLE